MMLVGGIAVKVSSKFGGGDDDDDDDDDEVCSMSVECYLMDVQLSVIINYDLPDVLILRFALVFEVVPGPHSGALIFSRQKSRFLSETDRLSSSRFCCSFAPS